MRLKVSLAVVALTASSLLCAAKFPMFSHTYKRAFVKKDSASTHYNIIDKTGIIRGYDNEECRQLLADYVARNNITFTTTTPEISYSFSYTPETVIVKREGGGVIINVTSNRKSKRTFATKALYDVKDGKKHYHNHKIIDVDGLSPELLDALAKLDKYMEDNDL